MHHFMKLNGILDSDKNFQKFCSDTFQKKVSRNGYQTTRNGLKRRENVSWEWKFFWKNSENFCPKCPNGIIISEGPKHKFYNSEMECYEASIFFQARAENMCWIQKQKKGKSKDIKTVTRIFVRCDTSVTIKIQVMTFFGHIFLFFNLMSKNVQIKRVSSDYLIKVHSWCLCVRNRFSDISRWKNPLSKPLPPFPMVQPQK